MYYKLPEPKNTRDLIIFHAFHEMYRLGYSRTSVADLCEKTKLSKGAFFHHFESKHDLALAVIKEVLVPLGVEGWFAYLEKNADPVQGIQEAVGRVKNLVTEEELRLGCAYQNLSQELSAIDGEFKKIFQKMFTLWIGAIDKALARGQAAGLIRPDVDTHAAALQVLSAFFGAIALGRSFNSRKVLNELLDQCVAVAASLENKKTMKRPTSKSSSRRSSAGRSNEKKL
jgi:TetR/AcrR family transcriptional repressor of nem operon